jgi:hypothetical protein
MSLLKLTKTMMLVLVVIIALSIFWNEDTWSMDLSQFKWKNRLLLIFAPKNNDPFFSALQNEISAQKSEVLVRDLVVFKIFETGPSFMDTTQIDHTTAESIRKQFDVPPGRFTVILVGKDGGVKLMRNAMVKLKDIFALIDAMPMRQEEMRQKAE